MKPIPQIDDLATTYQLKHNYQLQFNQLPGFICHIGAHDLHLIEIILHIKSMHFTGSVPCHSYLVG